MFPRFLLQARARRLARLHWLLAMERQRPWCAYLLVGLLRPFGVLPALPAIDAKRPPAVAFEVLLAGLLLFVLLWFAAGPLLATVQPVMTEVGAWPAGVLWSAGAVLLLSWRVTAGARYLDQARLTLSVAELEACQA